MDKNLHLEVIDLDTDDDCDVEINSGGTSIATVSEKINLNRITYIKSNRQNIIFPGYNTKIYTELVNYICSKQKTDLLHSSQCCDSKIEDLLYVFNPRTWLNDRMIDHYFTLLTKSVKDHSIMSLDPFFLNCFAIYGMEKATKSIKGTVKNIFNFDKVIIPTNLQDIHWTFTVVDMKKQTITLYDSNSKKVNFYESEICLLLDYLNDAYNFIRKPYDKPFQWKLRHGRSPLQNNNYDCGIFTCTNARHVLLGKSLYYSQDDAPLLRHRITYEILHDVLLPTP
ncbi:sentrin-specific protease 2-like [Rhopalosiphum padi]|uniref:sentrin-specific protease 2-like n=1 Tax=Rhopalosiphum padi TaxID=40932 RepID=UPI00298E3FFC|nr:sentrin-specific protease 2-like [Rhopalosiphum padi]